MANQRGAAGEQDAILAMELWVPRPKGETLRILIEELAARRSNVEVVVDETYVSPNCDAISMALGGECILRPGHEDWLRNVCFRGGQSRRRAGWGMISADKAGLSVSDTGTGIPAQELASIFEPFASKRGSSGLRLSTSRGIVEAFGGKIWAMNRAAGSAVFQFTLPLFHA